MYKKTFIILLFLATAFSGFSQTEVTPQFVTVWKTDKKGDTANNQIGLPLTENGEYDFIIEWGDGQQDHILHFNSPELVHTYETPGIYEVTINGIISGWQFGKPFNNDPNEFLIAENGDARKLLEVKKWGSLSFGDTLAQFTGCTNLIITAEDIPDLSATTNLSQAFKFCSFEKINSFNEWQTGNIEKMRYMFFSAHNFSQDLPDWDTSNVTDMRGMFSDCWSFDGDISSWNVSSVIYFSNMFNLCEPFNQDISSWNTLNAGYMDGMFMYAKAFNQDIPEG